jgi:hypothetical protein
MATSADAKTETPRGVWRPTFETQDAWMDKPGTRHRLMFDTVTAPAAKAAVDFATNYYVANKIGYGLEPETLGVIVVLRKFSTVFGFDDAIWVKYGAIFADNEKTRLEGELAARARSGNPLLSAAEPSKAGPDSLATLSSLAIKGARFAVCGMATHMYAGLIAKAAGKSAPDVEAELKASLIDGAVLVPAGITAVDRAQEHGYAFSYVAD